MRKVLMSCISGLLLSNAYALFGAEAPASGKVERYLLHSEALSGNLSGDSPDRYVSVYLPPSYASSPKRRYPVVYFLHGFTDNDEKWFGHNGVNSWVQFPKRLDEAIADGAREMIVVMPNAFTRFEGSMYSNSVTVGNWEDFVTRELVAHIDKKYRTLATPASRGLAGHSMGGYGTLRLAMKHPKIFSAIYALSPCCLGAPDFRQPRPGAEKIESYKSLEEILNAGFFAKAQFASAAAWSPNPKKPPFYVDLPLEGGQLQASVLARWAANAPLAMVDQYIGNLKGLQAIAIDAGDKDTAIAATVRSLHEILDRYGVPHFSEIYDGNHVNRIPERIRTQMMPFFSKNLKF